MDKSQFLLEKMDLPRTKNFRFSVVMKNFSIISLVIIFLYGVLFAVLSVWQMVLVCGICAFLWVGILLINRQGMIQAAFLVGVLNSTVFALLTTWLLGWSSGFFFMALLIIPVIFHNSYWNQILKCILAFAILAVIIGLFPFAGNALPFFSAGGSNLVTTLMAVGILMNISRTNLANEAKDGSAFSAVVDLRRWNGRRRVSRTRRSSVSVEQN